MTNVARLVGDGLPPNETLTVGATTHSLTDDCMSSCSCRAAPYLRGALVALPLEVGARSLEIGARSLEILHERRRHVSAVATTRSQRSRRRGAPARASERAV